MCNLFCDSSPELAVIILTHLELLSQSAAHAFRLTSSAWRKYHAVPRYKRIATALAQFNSCLLRYGCTVRWVLHVIYWTHRLTTGTYKACHAYYEALKLTEVVGAVLQASMGRGNRPGRLEVSCFWFYVLS